MEGLDSSVKTPPVCLAAQIVGDQRLSPGSGHRNVCTCAAEALRDEMVGQAAPLLRKEGSPVAVF